MHDVETIEASPSKSSLLLLAKRVKHEMRQNWKGRNKAAIIHTMITYAENLQIIRTGKSFSKSLNVRLYTKSNRFPI